MCQHRNLESNNNSLLPVVLIWSTREKALVHALEARAESETENVYDFDVEEENGIHRRRLPNTSGNWRQSFVLIAQNAFSEESRPVQISHFMLSLYKPRPCCFHWFYLQLNQHSTCQRNPRSHQFRPERTKHPAERVGRREPPDWTKTTQCHSRDINN